MSQSRLQELFMQARDYQVTLRQGDELVAAVEAETLYVSGPLTWFDFAAIERDRQRIVDWFQGMSNRMSDADLRVAVDSCLETCETTFIRSRAEAIMKALVDPRA